MEKEVLNRIEQYVDSHQDEMIEKYRELINLKDFWRDADAVSAVAVWLKKEFEDEGFLCELVDVAPESGKLLMGILGENRDKEAILFSGHMDTALASDLYPEEPFTVKDGNAYGPGVLDMKGGILISLYVVKALNSIGYNERPLKILFAPDEEGLHHFTNVADLIKENSKHCLFALNMETGLMDNGLAVGRKGRLGIDVFVKGRSAHAGAAFLDGISSIEEMAHKVLAFQSLTDIEKGTTVNTGVIKGGTIPNAVPAECMCQLDIRFKTVKELNRVKESVRQICEKNYVGGTSCTYTELNLFTPLETDHKIMALYDFMADVARKYNYPDTTPVQVGGCSDATFIQQAGTPVLCSCGVRGNWNHTLREFAVVSSLYDRVKWFTAAIVDAGALNF